MSQYFCKGKVDLRLVIESNEAQWKRRSQRLYFYTHGREGKVLLEIRPDTDNNSVVEILFFVPHRGGHSSVLVWYKGQWTRQLDRLESRPVCPFIGPYKVPRCGVHNTLDYPIRKNVARIPPVIILCRRNSWRDLTRFCPRSRLRNS